MNLKSFYKYYFFIFLIIITVGNSCQSTKELYLLAGTYTKTESKGIYVYKFNPESGNSSFVGSTDSANNPSFLAFSKSFVYAANETGGDNPGQVSAYLFDKNSGNLNTNFLVMLKKIGGMRRFL